MWSVHTEVNLLQCTTLYRYTSDAKSRAFVMPTVFTYCKLQLPHYTKFLLLPADITVHTHQVLFLS